MSLIGHLFSLLVHLKFYDIFFTIISKWIERTNEKEGEQRMSFRNIRPTMRVFGFNSEVDHYFGNDRAAVITDYTQHTAHMHKNQTTWEWLKNEIHRNTHNSFALIEIVCIDVRREQKEKKNINKTHINCTPVQLISYILRKL